MNLSRRTFILGAGAGTAGLLLGKVKQTVEGNYQAIQLVLEAVRQAKGNTSAKALIKALLATNMDSTRGHVTMSPEGYCISNHYIVEVVKNQTAPIYDYTVVEKTTRQIIK